MRIGVIIVSALLLLVGDALAAPGYRIPQTGGVPSGVPWEHILSLDDNAGTTTVVNTGTDGNNWTATVNTDTLHSSTVKEGTGSFLLDASGDQAYSGSNWTDEKFIAQFWVRWPDATPAANAGIMLIGDGDEVLESNEVRLQLQTSGVFHIGAYGNSGTFGTRTDDDAWAPADNTWYYIQLVVDASVSPWTTTLGYNTDGSDSFTDLSLTAWSASPAIAVFNSLVYISTANGFQTRGHVDYFRMRSN